MVSLSHSTVEQSSQYCGMVGGAELSLPLVTRHVLHRNRYIDFLPLIEYLIPERGTQRRVTGRARTPVH